MSVKIEFEKVWGEGWWAREKKVGKHKRRLNGEEYVSPRIVLSSDYNHFIGKNFEVYQAKGTITKEEWSRTRERTGTFLILFFPDVQVEDFEEEEFDDFDEEF
jgi:hypothetical protein